MTCVSQDFRNFTVIGGVVWILFVSLHYRQLMKFFELLFAWRSTPKALNDIFQRGHQRSIINFSRIQNRTTFGLIVGCQQLHFCQSTCSPAIRQHYAVMDRWISWKNLKYEFYDFQTLSHWESQDCCKHQSQKWLPPLRLRLAAPMVPVLVCVCVGCINIYIYAICVGCMVGVQLPVPSSQTGCTYGPSTGRCIMYHYQSSDWLHYPLLIFVVQIIYW